MWQGFSDWLRAFAILAIMLAMPAYGLFVAPYFWNKSMILDSATQQAPAVLFAFGIGLVLGLVLGAGLMLFVIELVAEKEATQSPIEEDVPDRDYLDSLKH